MDIKLSEEQTNSSQSIVENPNAQKENFLSPTEKLKLHDSKKAEMQSKVGKEQAAKNLSEDNQSKIIDDINASLNKGKSKWDSNEDVQLSDEEQDALEQIIFNGFAVYDIPLGIKDRKVTIASQSPLDHEIVEICMKKFIASATVKKGSGESLEIDDDNSILISEGTLMSRRDMYSMALSVVGFDSQDLAQDEMRQFSLKVIKAAYKKAVSLLNSGNIEGYRELANSVIKGVNYRASILMGYGNLLIDVINTKKYEYENKLFTALESKKDKAYPKS